MTGCKRTGIKGEMMSIEPRNEPQMLRWFRKTPSYNLQPLLQQLAGRAQASAGGATAPGQREPADRGRAPPGTPAALRARRAPGRGTGSALLLSCVSQPVVPPLAVPPLLVPWWCLRWWCLRRCRLNRRLWLALWGSRLSRHVLLRFVLAARGPPPSFRLRAASGAACSPLAPLVRSAPSFSIIRGQDITRTTKTIREAVQSGRKGDGALRAIKCPSLEPVSTMVRRSSVLPALCAITQRPASPPETKLGPSMWSTLKGLVGEAGGAEGSPLC